MEKLIYVLSTKIPLPSSSPDINVIEQVWNCINELTVSIPRRLTTIITAGGMSLMLKLSESTHFFVLLALFR